MDMSNQTMPPTPRPSATVMVMRPVDESGAGEFEIFMVRRSGKSQFMPDHYVFPGGRLEERDWQPAALARLAGFEPHGPAPIFRDKAGRGAFDRGVPLERAQEAGLYVAAFRELFEEAGVLLAVEEENGREFDMQADDRLPSHYAARRKLLNSGELDFLTMLTEEKLLLDMNRLVYYSHWITPLSEPRRFDTRFFLAATPLNQLAESDYIETTDGVWITPRQLLERAATNEFTLAFPTLLHVQRLAACASISAALEAGRTKPLVSVMPDQLPPTEDSPAFGLTPDMLANW